MGRAADPGDVVAPIPCAPVLSRLLVIHLPRGERRCACNHVAAPTPTVCLAGHHNWSARRRHRPRRVDRDEVDPLAHRHDPHGTATAVSRREPGDWLTTSRNNHVARLQKVAAAHAQSEDHKIVAIARETGLDLLDGSGPKDTLTGVKVVIDRAPAWKKPSPPASSRPTPTTLRASHVGQCGKCGSPNGPISMYAAIGSVYPATGGSYHLGPARAAVPDWRRLAATGCRGQGGRSAPGCVVVEVCAVLRAGSAGSRRTRGWRRSPSSAHLRVLLRLAGGETTRPRRARPLPPRRAKITAFARVAHMPGRRALTA